MDKSQIKKTSLRLVFILIALLRKKKDSLQKASQNILKNTRINKIVNRSHSQTCKILSDELSNYFPINRTRQKLLSAINRGDNKEQKNLFLKQINYEIFLNSIFILLTQPLIQISIIVKESIKEKFLSNLKKQFHPLKNPQLIANSVLQELFECLFDNGVKNVQLFVRNKVGPLLFNQDPERVVSREQFMEIYDELYSEISGVESLGLVQPSDNRRLSGITFKHLGRSSSNDLLQTSRSSDQLFQNMLLTDFADIRYSHDKSHSYEFNCVSVDAQILRTNNKIHDAIYMWLGDILRNKIFQDSEYIMRTIEKTDIHCRQEKYKPKLHKISEQIEEEDFGMSEGESPFITPTKRQLNLELQPEMMITQSNGNHSGALMLHSKLRFQEYLKNMCHQSIDLLKSVNVQIIFSYYLKEQFNYFKSTVMRYPLYEDRQLWWYSFHLTHKITDQLSLSHSAHLMKQRGFQRAVKKSLHDKKITNEQAILLRRCLNRYQNYLTLDVAMKQFVTEYINTPLH